MFPFKQWSTRLGFYRLFPKPIIDLAFLKNQGALAVYNLEIDAPTNPITRMGSLQSRHLLIIMADHPSESIRLVFRALKAAIPPKASPLEGIWHPWVLTLRIDQALTRLKKTLPDAENAFSACRIFLVQDRQCYLLFPPNNTASAFIYRHRNILEYRLNTQQFILLEPQDLLILTTPRTLSLLKHEGIMKSLGTIETPLKTVLREYALSRKRICLSSESNLDSIVLLRNQAGGIRHRGTGQNQRVEWIGRFLLIVLYSVFSALMLLSIYWLI